jgi:hypothetical protein
VHHLRRSERLYCVRPAADEKAQGLSLAAPRGLSPPATRVLRLFMHLAMTAGLLAPPSSPPPSAAARSLSPQKEDKGSRDAPAETGSSEQWSSEVLGGFFNSSFVAPGSCALLAGFLAGHVEQDWGALQTLSSLQEDEAGLLLHGVLGGLLAGLGEALGYTCSGITPSTSTSSTGSSASSSSSSSARRFSFARGLPADVALPGRTPGGNGGSLERSFAVLSLSSDRAFWEAYMDKVHIAPWLTPAAVSGRAGGGGGSLSEHLGGLTAAWSLEEEGEGEEGSGSASHFTVMLLERDSSPLAQPTLLLPALLPARQALLPALWRLPRVFCFDEFVSSLSMLEATAAGSTGSSARSGDYKKYPILSSFMTMFAADPAQLYALRFLPQVFEWFHSLRRHYSGHVTREDARSMTHLDCLRDVASTDPGGHWEGVFRSYSQAWNASWVNVQKYGCIQFSPDFKSIHMGPDVPLTFSLPNAMDEGNCPLALTHFLVEKQNTFAQLLDEHFLLQQRDGRQQQQGGGGGGGGDPTTRRVGVVSSRFLTAAHTIRCDLHRDLIPLLEKHCLLLPSSAPSTAGGGGSGSSSGGMGGGGKYDFARAERLLVERFLLDVPAVDLEVPGFTFKNEQHLQGKARPPMLASCAALCAVWSLRAALEDGKYHDATAYRSNVCHGAWYF